MPRPFWSGQIQISLVSFGVRLFPATETKSEIHFHQISRRTGERVHHEKVTGNAGDGGDTAPIEKDEIVKGYEFRKGEYVAVEPGEIDALRIPSRHTLAVTQFVALEELSPALFEKPYFVVPDGDNQTEAFTVIRKALQETRKAALGKIAFSGREHLIAITASPSKSEPGDNADDAVEHRGMMAYTLRYAEELRKSEDYFSEIKKTAIDEDQLSLAKELIQRKAARFAPEKFRDEYEAALREMVEAKVNHAPLPKDAAAPKRGKVINLMDALRKSMQPEAGAQKSATNKATPEPATRKKKTSKPEPAEGMKIVKPRARPSKSTSPRKSA